MKTMTVGEFKAQFSQALKDVENGEKIGITFGRKKEIKAMLVPNATAKPAIQLGILKGKVDYFMRDDFNETSEEEFGI